MMKNMILETLAFLLGKRHKTAKELESTGHKMMTEYILKKLALRVEIENILNIWLLGAIEYSEVELSKIEGDLRKGNRYVFSPPINYDFEESYIDFYQVSMKDNRWFIFAMTDLYEFSQEDSEMMFVEVRQRYNTNELDQKMLLFGGLNDVGS